MSQPSTATRLFSTAALLLLLGLAPGTADAEVTVATPTGDVEAPFLAQMKGSLETVVREAALPDAVNAELRLTATAATDGVSLAMELVPANGSETKRAERIASPASAVAQVRAMARELLEPATERTTPPLVAAIAETPAPALPPVPRLPPRIRWDSSAFFGLFWLNDLKLPTGGLDFGMGCHFDGGVGVGSRLAISLVVVSYRGYDGDDGIATDDSDFEFSAADVEQGVYVHKDVPTTMFTWTVDLLFGNPDLFYATLLLGVRTAIPGGFAALPLPYVGFGFDVTPLRHKRIALLLRVEAGYWTYAAFDRDAAGKGLEPHGAVGVQF